jgi:hypothetical protein
MSVNTAHVMELTSEIQEDKISTLWRLLIPRYGEVEMAIREMLRMQELDFQHKGMFNLAPRMKMCSEYVRH